MRLRDLPWHALRRAVYNTRRIAFERRAPSEDERGVVARPLPDVRRRLAAHGYEPGWPLSYHYEGESLNARRYVHRPARDHQHQQLHIRGWEDDNGVLTISAHEEPAPLHHPYAHLAGAGSRDRTAYLAGRLEAGGSLAPPSLDEPGSTEGLP